MSDVTYASFKGMIVPSLILTPFAVLTLNITRDHVVSSKFRCYYVFGIRVALVAIPIE